MRPPASSCPLLCWSNSWFVTCVIYHYMSRLVCSCCFCLLPTKHVAASAFDSFFFYSYCKRPIHNLARNFGSLLHSCHRSFTMLESWRIVWLVRMSKEPAPNQPARQDQCPLVRLREANEEATDAPPRPRTAFFLGLPAEQRLQIYGHVFTEASISIESESSFRDRTSWLPDRLRRQRTISIISVCRLIRCEALEVLSQNALKALSQRRPSQM